MELREATRFYRQVKTAAYEPTHESRKFDFSFSDEKGRQLLLMYVVPILVGLKIVDISLYNQFVCGKSSKPLMDIYKDSDKGEWLATRLLNRNEAFEVEEGKSVVTVEQKSNSYTMQFLLQNIREMCIIPYLESTSLMIILRTL